MLVRAWVCLLLACAVSVLIGCGPSLVNMSAGQIGCRPGDVTITDVHNSFGSRNWVAVCHGAEFSCSEVTSGGGWTSGSQTSSQVNCSPMGGGSVSTRSAPAAAPAPSRSTSTPSRGVGSAEVKRGYDEGRQAHFVTGKFGVASGLTVIISGAPKVSLGTISVTLSGYASSSVRLCTALEVLINGEPIGTEHNEGAPISGGVKIESKFDFSVFQPLAGRFPVFGVRACGTTWAFTPEQVEKLRALLVVYSDLAEEIQNDADANPQPAPGQTAL